MALVSQGQLTRIVKVIPFFLENPYRVCISAFFWPGMRVQLCSVQLVGEYVGPASRRRDHYCQLLASLLGIVLVSNRSLVGQTGAWEKLSSLSLRLIIEVVYTCFAGAAS